MASHFAGKSEVCYKTFHLAAKIAVLFQTLNTPPERRLASLDETVVAFPYVNGNLFGEMLPIPAFSCEMRRALLDCGSLDWSKISPAIFGAMFQGVMDEEMRHDLGAHYTSEENILKVIRPLFLDRLREEFDTICLTTGPSRKVKLAAFHGRIASLTFLDPACGCGWYKKANDLIRGTATRCAFVSTNSITQGETAAALWPNLAVEIDFAYRTFKWHNEAKGNAAVHYVIIGFHAAEESRAESAENAEAESPVGNAPRSPREKTIYDGDAAIRVKNINCYLMDAPDIIVTSRNVALCDVPKMVNGNKPVDGGYLILTQKDIVYNNFVWPTIEQSEHSNIRTIISSAAQEILDVRKRYLDADSECTLAILYNPETMPPDLVKAHQKLDALVDKAYGRTFANDAERVAYLFNLYAQCVAAEKDTAICILSTE